MFFLLFLPVWLMVYPFAGGVYATTAISVLIVSIWQIVNGIIALRDSGKSSQIQAYWRFQNQLREMRMSEDDWFRQNPKYAHLRRPAAH